MDHLIRNRMMFGNMILVDSEVWVERYNRALSELTGRKTSLPDFHIDISGYSPEVADELGCADYLKTEHGNRQFILLTPEQASAPMITGKFSYHREGLKTFIRKNVASISVITTHDVMIGDIDDMSWRVQHPHDLTRLRSVKYSAGALNGGCADSSRMKTLADRFMTEDEAWMDSRLISSMIDLVQKNGELVRSPVCVDDMILPIGSFYSSLFGGVYVLRGIGDENAEVMAFRTEGQKSNVRNAEVYDVKDAEFLSRLQHAGAFVELADKNAHLPVLRRRKAAAMIDCLCAHGVLPPQDADARTLRREIGKTGAVRSEQLETLSDFVRALEMGEMPHMPAFGSVSWPYVHRAKAGPNRDVINAILGELMDSDPSVLFALNKPAFLSVYARWTDEKKAAFAAQISSEYLSHKDRYRAETFG